MMRVVDMSGWIKLHRDMEHSGVWRDAKAYRVFSWLLWHANYKERTLLNGLTLKAGQLCTSRARIAAGCFMPETTINRVLKRLANGKCIVTKANSRGTVIEVINWGKYQHDEDTSGLPTVYQRSANGLQTVTEEEGKKGRREELSICPQPDGLQTVNGSKVKLSYSADFEQFWQTFPSRRKTKKRKAFADFKKATKRVDLTTLIAAVEEYARSNKGRGEYCQMPSTWLNGDCWEDDRASWDEGTPIPVARKPRTQEQSRIEAAETRLVAMRCEFMSMPQGDDRDAAVAEWRRCKEILANMEAEPCSVN
jgi:hypothetical protein